MSEMTKGQRKALRAALRGMLWLTSADARARGFDPARINPDTVDVTEATRCPLGQSGPEGGSAGGRWRFVTAAAGHDVYEEGQPWADRRGFGDCGATNQALNDAWSALLGAYRELMSE